VTAPVVVVGGGIGGATAALRLAQAGEPVVRVERAPALGGLVVSFEVGGTPLECFYHHVFPHESAIVALVHELGLGGHLEWLPGTMGVYAQGRVWPFTSPLHLLRFGPLPLADRVRTGIGALRLARVRDWEPLDTLPARDWLAGATGERAAAVVWEPLLRAKFGGAAPGVPAAWMWGRFQQRAGARRGSRGQERLGYLRGGFRQLFDALDAELRRLGVDVRTGTGVTSIALDGGRVAGVQLDGGRVAGVQLDGGGALDARAVVFTGPLPALPALVPAEAADPRWSAIASLGVLCVVLEMDGPLTDCYWTNVCDPDLPFGGIIEHTNLVPASDYGGRHVVYLSRYFTPDEPIAAADAERWAALLDERFPGTAGRVLAVHPFRTAHAAPLVQVGHLARIPPMAGPPAGLFVSTTAQIYPEDRGMNEGVRTGTAVAEAVLATRAGLVEGAV
jgi:protoporphyrinogen oxidase